MSKIIAIVGPSGSGKSTSLRNLDPKSTYVIDILGKGLPFKDSSEHYNQERKNYVATDNYKTVHDILRAINTNRTDVTCVVIDDAGFIMQTEFFERASEKSYEKFSEMGQHMFKILREAKSMREDLIVVILFHTEDIVSGQTIVGKKIKTIGKMLDEKYDPQALTNICLYTHVSEGDKGPSYNFITNKFDVYPAKSPMDMFDDIMIPNDLQFVLNSIKQYYK